MGGIEKAIRRAKSAGCIEPGSGVRCLVLSSHTWQKAGTGSSTYAVHHLVPSRSSAFPGVSGRCFPEAGGPASRGGRTSSR